MRWLHRVAEKYYSGVLLYKGYRFCLLGLTCQLVNVWGLCEKTRIPLSDFHRHPPCHAWWIAASATTTCCRYCSEACSHVPLIQAAIGANHTMILASVWRTKVLRVSHGGTPRMGPVMAHDLLKDARQGGVDFKLFQINLVGLLWKLDYVKGLELFSYTRLGLDTYPYPLSPI